MIPATIARTSQSFRMVSRAVYFLLSQKLCKEHWKVLWKQLDVTYLNDGSASYIGILLFLNCFRDTDANMLTRHT